MLSRSRSLLEIEDIGLCNNGGFPKLNYYTPLQVLQKISVLKPQDDNYNCFAYAFHVFDEWLYPDNYGHGLIGMDRFAEEWGYYRLERMNLKFLRNALKVAIYAKEDGSIAHAALRVPNGWESKLGAGCIISHKDLAYLSGPLYGSPIAIYRTFIGGFR